MKVIIDNKEYELTFVSSENYDDEYRAKYICPLCGKGYFIHVDEETPGFRDHYSYLNCDNCDPNELIYTNSDNSWNLRKRTPKEIEHIKARRAKYANFEF